MKKRIILTDGSKIEVETDGGLYGFMAGDVVTRDEKLENFSHWKNKRVFIEGFWDGKMWGTIDGEKNSLFCEDSDGLILFKRPRLQFEVGDDVVGIGHRVKGKKGEIIVICPYEYHGQPFLVKFENFIDGHDAGSFWPEPWYPNFSKIHSNCLLWNAKNDLQFLKKKAPHKKVIWREKPDLRETT